MAPVPSSLAYTGHTFRDILALFTRRELCTLSAICRRFDNVITAKFPSAPFLIFEDLLFDEGVWNMIDLPDEIDETTVPSPTALYLRFNDVEIFLQNSSVDMLQSVCHVWEQGNLEIFCNDIISPTEHLAESVSNCSRLNIYGIGDLSIIKNLLPGNCEKIIVEDHICGSLASLPLDGMVEFLFKPVRRFRYLELLSVKVQHQFPDFEQCVKFVDMVKQKFLEATTPVRFHFAITIEDCEEKIYPNDFTVHNATIKQDMSLNSWNGELEINAPADCSYSDNDDSTSEDESEDDS
ncbi:hypothetical protein Ddc_00099 [Ditylenchus destructor]|nr:hypothetical protein Ddc_00099 [Ditylenchus destructor]